MNRSLFYGLGFALLVISAFWGLLFQPGHSSAEGTQTPFLHLPFYGNKTITSFVDHEYPTYRRPPDNDNNIFTRQDGQRWTPPTPVEAHNCYSNGERRCYDGHSGIDYSMAYERVLAAADGTVLFADWYVSECYTNLDECFYGMTIQIEHDVDENNTRDYITLYGHLSSIAVAVGDKVEAGQVIATSGKTGNITGPHLHFQVVLPTPERQPVDPYGWGAPAGTPDPWAVHDDGATSWCMWMNAGSACTPPTVSPPPEYETITIDHPNLAFTKGCSWGGIGCWTLISAGQGGSSWATNLAQLNDWARWQPPLNTQAVYEVRVHVPNYGIRTYEARYEVQSVAGLKSNLRISQHDTSDADRWYSLGTYMFQSGFGGYVKVIDHLPQGSTNDRLLLADAVRFVRISNPPTPTPTRTAPSSRTPTHTPTITYTPTPGPTQPCPLSENGNNPPCTPTPSLTPTPTPTLSSTPTSVPPTTTPGGSMYFVQPASVEGIVVLFNHTPPACSADTNSIQCSGTFPHSWANAYYAGVHGTFSYHQDPSQTVGFFFTATAFDSIAEINLAGRGGQTDIYIADNTGITSPLNEVVMCFGGRYSLVYPYWEYNHFNDQSLFECDYVIDRTAYSAPVTYFNPEASTLEILAFSRFDGLPHEWSFTVHDFGYLLYGLPPTATPTVTPTNTPAGGTYTPLAPVLLPTGTPTLVP